MPTKEHQEFNEHLETCPQCEKNPMDLCADGERLLKAAFASVTCSQPSTESAPAPTPTHQSAVRQTLSVSVPIADVLLHGMDAASAKILQVALSEKGVPDGTPVEVEVSPRRHDYEARATW